MYLSKAQIVNKTRMKKSSQTGKQGRMQKGMQALGFVIVKILIQTLHLVPFRVIFKMAVAETSSLCPEYHLLVSLYK